MSHEPDSTHDSDTASEFWELRYGDAGPIWSGRPNVALVDTVSEMTPGTALDLGSGEGGDAIWLATRGWTVTAVDIATAAIERGRAAAATDPDVAARVAWVAADLSTWTTDATFDLVSACFLHSPFGFPRTAVLRRAAGRVAPGGHLLVVGHAAFPSWSAHDHDDVPVEEGSRLRSPEEQVTDLALDPAAWSVEIAALRTRNVLDPQGRPAPLDDTVVLARRVQ